MWASAPTEGTGRCGHRPLRKEWADVGIGPYGGNGPMWASAPTCKSGFAEKPSPSGEGGAQRRMRGVSTMAPLSSERMGRCGHRPLRREWADVCIGPYGGNGPMWASAHSEGKGRCGHRPLRKERADVGIGPYCHLFQPPKPQGKPPKPQPKGSSPCSPWPCWPWPCWPWLCWPWLCWASWGMASWRFSPTVTVICTVSPLR